MARAFTSDEATGWLRLSYAGLPTARSRGLLRDFPTPTAIFQAAADSPAQLQTEFSLSEAALKKLRDAAHRDVSKELEAMETHGISVATPDEFPALLCETGDDCPPFLFIRGEFVPADENCIAIVGTRNVTEYGRGIAHRFALELARSGWTIVSGLARGIDTAAHRGALDGGGRTIAATGCGLDIVYPAENRDLMSEVAQSGAVLSEWAPTTQPVAWHFPARNRIIAGLSRAVIVVEAQQKSGALITATFAAEHDRTVFAVPGNVHKAQSRGPHLLIKEGAVLVESVEDILSYLSSEVSPLISRGEADEESNGRRAPSPVRQQKSQRRVSSEGEPVLKSSRPAKTRPIDSSQVSLPLQLPVQMEAPTGLSSNESRVWLCLEFEPRHFDDIAESAALEAGATNAALVMLELKGLAQRQPGNVFVRKERGF